MKYKYTVEFKGKNVTVEVKDFSSRNSPGYRQITLIVGGTPMASKNFFSNHDSRVYVNRPYDKIPGVDEFAAQVLEKHEAEYDRRSAERLAALVSAEQEIEKNEISKMRRALGLGGD